MNTIVNIVYYENIFLIFIFIFEICVYILDFVINLSKIVNICGRIIKTNNSDVIAPTAIIKPICEIVSIEEITAIVNPDIENNIADVIIDGAEF